MDNGGRKITGLKLYICGYCRNDLGIVFRNHPKDIRDFPAPVVYMRHREFGNILFDTGYSELVYKNGMTSFIYNRLNKTFITPDKTIDRRLSEDGIGAINYIILSHTHPDHIGALRRFSNYKLIATRDTLKQLFAKRGLSLTFRNMAPELGDYLRPVKPLKDKGIFSDFSEVYDIFGDSSVIGIRLDGHANGQMGLYLPEYKLFFAADACWGTDLLEEIPRMRPLPRLIQNDFEKYKTTAALLQKFRKSHPEIKIIFSHENIGEIAYGQ